MLRPFLIIGVGGSGGKTLRGVTYQLQLKLQQIGWKSGIPAAWQFLHFDTPTAQDGADFALPFLPVQQYRGLVSTGASYNTVYRSIESSHASNPRVHQDIQRQLPDPRYVKVDVTKGAGQFRAVGRTVALSSTKEIAAAARAAIARLSDASAIAELGTLGQFLRARGEGGDGSPTVIVISSVAGGSGAGQFLDVIEVVKSTAKQHPWSKQFFSMLYAPDVFDQLNVSAGMPGNALAAITETMNGFWTNTPSESTLELLKSQGVAPSYGDAMDRVGAAYPFIVGRSNSKVTFEDQSAVYNAVATSLTAWMTDERVQDDMIAYSSGNWQARVGANVLPDASGLASPVHHSPPFSSMGFGRVTLGRERFLEYSAERFARSVIDRMLRAHSESDPLFAQKTEREWVESGADKSYQRFVTDLQLNEETESHNQVIDALRADQTLTEVKGELDYGVSQRLTQGGPFDKSGGLDLSVWNDRLIAEYSIRAPELLERDQRARQGLLEDWTKRMPSEILHTVARYVSEVGLPVVVAMLTRLDRTLRSVAEGLESESHQRDEWVISLRSLVADELAKAPNQNSIRPDQDVIGYAIERLTQALEWASEARLRESASKLVNELRTEFFAPLRTHLDGALQALRQRVGDRQTSDERENEFQFWPTRGDSSVPRKYEPAPNERLLVEHRDYPAEFERLVRSSVEGSGIKYQDAILTVITDMLVGEPPARVREDEPSSWGLIANTRSWKSSVTADPETSFAPQAPHFRMETEPEVYLERARLWMRREGMPFQAYISEDLLNFFDETAITPDVFARRRDRYREQLQAALGASEPLVKLNAALLRAVHDKAINEDTSLVISSIPFRAGTEMYTVTKAVLGQLGFWDDATSESWFRDAKVDGIEVFAMSGFPYQPIVMDSVMEPIARGWLGQSSTQDSRQAFWQFKRARLLGEAVPADQRVIASMIRGWYVAKTLNRLPVPTQHGERGPKLSIWDAASRGVVDFPHPLLSPRNAQPQDFPGAVMQSLTIAIALCQVDGTLSPLDAYKALAGLGGEQGAPAPALIEWLQHGSVDKGAPAPAVSRAGSPEGDLTDRQQAVRDYLEGELARFRSDVVEQDDHVSVYDYPVTWELREEIVEEIEGLLSAVMATRSDDLGCDVSDRFWPDAKASIVLLPSGGQGEALLALAAEWTKMGLVGPALSVLPERVSDSPGGPPRIVAVVLGIGADLEVVRVEVDLFEALAREALTVVRLVKLRSAAPSRELDGHQDAIAERVREYVRKSMPMPNPGASIVDQSAELRYATLICAPTEFQLKQRVDWAGSEYGVVVIASPEDRSSPWSGDAFVRDDERFMGFTLLHVASVAGLWSGVPTGSFELVRREESGQRSVWLSRVFVNAVLTESLGRRAAAHVLTEAARPDSMLVDPSFSAPPQGTVFIEDSSVSGYVDAMVRGAISLDEGALLFREPHFDPDPDKRRVGFSRQLGRFLLFSGDKLAKMPGWSWRWITSGTYRRMTRALHTDEGAEVVGDSDEIIFDVRERALIADAERIVEDEHRARAEASAPTGLSHVRTTPALWARLRELVFGALDGSADLSELGFRPIEDAVPIFGRVSDVLALPDQPWVPPRDLVPGDFPEKVDWYVLTLDNPRERMVDASARAMERRIEAERKVSERQGDLAEAKRATPSAAAATAAGVGPASYRRARREWNRGRVAGAGQTAGDGRPSADESTADAEAQHPAPPMSVGEARHRVERAQVQLERRSDEAERLADGVRAFDAWAVTQDRSFVWRLLTRLAQERRTAEQSSAQLSAEIDAASVPQPGELVVLRRRFHRTMLLTWIIGVAVAALLIAGLFAVRSAAERDPQFDPADGYAVLGWLLAITATVVIAFTIGALVAYHAGWSRFQRRIDVQRQRLAQLGRNSRLARQEAVRLASVHRQAVDWLVLLSRSIHRPWHVPESWLHRDEYAVARGAMPFALQIATVQDDDPAAAARLRGVMTAHLVVKGWRHEAFEALVREMALERGALSSSFGLHTLDEDLPHASNHSRRMLLSALDDEAILTRIAGPRLERLVRASQLDDSHASRPRVRPVLDNPLHTISRGAHRSADRLDVPWDEFLIGSLAGRRDPITPLSATVLTDVELGERHHERVQSHLVLPERLAVALQYPAGTPIQVIPFRDEVGAAVDLSWRVDIAGPVPIRAIHLWDPSGMAQEAPPEPIRRARDDDSGV